MQWVVGMPITKVEVNEEGGYSHGSGEMCNVSDVILVALAGFSYESGCGMFPIDFENSWGDDLDDARELLEKFPVLRIYADFSDYDSKTSNIDDFKPVVQDVEDAFVRWFERTCDALSPHCELVEIIGEYLQEEKVLSAKRVSEIIEEYEKY